MALAKKKLKHKSCEIIPEVKDQMLEAFNLLEEKKTDEAIVAFNKIVNESTVILTSVFFNHIFSLRQFFHLM